MEISEKTPVEMLPEEHGVPAADPQPTRGRPWVKGQSGNPQGRPKSRPSRAHQAAWVGQALIDRKTLQLVDAAIGWAQGGNKPMLRLCFDRLVPPRREAPVWLKLPPIEDRKGVQEALAAVANAVAQGDISSAHGLRLVRIYTEMWRYL